MCACLTLPSVSSACSKINVYSVSVARGCFHPVLFSVAIHYY